MGRKNKEVNPFSWDVISIEKYYEIVDILNDVEDDDITKNVKLVALITEKEENEVWDMGISEVGEYIGKLSFLNKFDIPNSPDMKIKLPNYDLKVIKDVTNINIAQYVDFQNFITMPLREGLDKILSIFLIPDGMSYNNGYDIIDLQKEIRENLSFKIAQGLMSFFLKRSVKLLVRSLTSLNRMMKKTKNQEMKEELMKKEEEIKNQFQNLIHLTGSFS